MTILRYKFLNDKTAELAFNDVAGKVGNGPPPWITLNEDKIVLTVKDVRLTKSVQEWLEGEPHNGKRIKKWFFVR